MMRAQPKATMPDVREAKAIALAWIDAAMTLLTAERSPVDEALLRAALATSFSLRGDEELRGVTLRVHETFARCRAVIAQGGRRFVLVNERTAKRLFHGSPYGYPAAYAIFGKAIYFTPRFKAYDRATGQGLGPKCRAAILLHESVHVIEPLGGLPETHISEWDEPRFSSQTIEESIHNPSAYASFAAQVFERAHDWPRDARYGMGRPAD